MILLIKQQQQKSVVLCQHSGYSRWRVGEGQKLEGRLRISGGLVIRLLDLCMAAWSLILETNAFFKKNKFIYFIYIYFWLHWVFVAVRGLLIAVSSLVAEHGLQVRGLQQLWPLGSVVVAHGLSCSAACGIFPNQGSNPCPLHWQVDS